MSLRTPLTLALPLVGALSLVPADAQGKPLFTAEPKYVGSLVGDKFTNAVPFAAAFPPGCVPVAIADAGGPGNAVAGGLAFGALVLMFGGGVAAAVALSQDKDPVSPAKLANLPGF